MTLLDQSFELTAVTNLLVLVMKQTKHLEILTKTNEMIRNLKK